MKLNTSKAEAQRQLNTCLDLYNDGQEYDFIFSHNEFKVTAICKPEQKHYLRHNETPIIEVTFNDGENITVICFYVTKTDFFVMLCTIDNFINTGDTDFLRQIKQDYYDTTAIHTI